MPDIDPALRLALTLRAQPGSYALLLGSGVSLSAGVPTGFDVLIRLITEVAEAQGVELKEPPQDWFRREIELEPTYDNVLDQFTLSPLERRGLLRKFFEANEEETESGLKQPTEAHRAIAQMVKAGFVNVILETNFDRLMEEALSAASVPYVVANTPGAVDALKPLRLQRCVVVKLHGDSGLHPEEVVDSDCRVQVRAA